MRRSPRQRYPYFPGDHDPFIRPLESTVAEPRQPVPNMFRLPPIDPSEYRLAALRRVLRSAEELSRVLPNEFVLHADPGGFEQLPSSSAPGVDPGMGNRVFAHLSNTGISQDQRTSETPAPSERGLLADPISYSRRGGVLQMRPGSEYVDENGNFESSRAVEDDWNLLTGDRVGRGIPLEPGSTIAERWAAARRDRRTTSSDLPDTYSDQRDRAIGAAERWKDPVNAILENGVLAAQHAYPFIERQLRGGLNTVEAFLRIPELLGFSGNVATRKDAIEAAGKNADAIASLLPLPTGVPPAPAASRIRGRALPDVRELPQFELPFFERLGDAVPKDMRDQRSLIPGVRSEPTEAWLYHSAESTRQLLRLLYPTHPFAFELPRFLTFGDLYEINRAYQLSRRPKSLDRQSEPPRLRLGPQWPGHHWAMDKYGREFHEIGMPRWMRDLFRNFIMRNEHNTQLHRELSEWTEDLLGYRGLTTDNALDSLRDFVFERGMWITP